MAVDDIRHTLPAYPILRSATIAVMRYMPMPASNADINREVADKLGLSPDQRALLHSPRSRQTELAYRVAWARTALHVAGAIEDAGRALWRITEEGHEIESSTIERRWALHLKSRKNARDGAPAAARDKGVADEIDVDWKEQLLTRVRRIEPPVFEHLATRLLEAAGFREVQVLGRAGDGGLDGVGIYRPTLISFPVYFQCKRYRGAVGSGAVRDFRGAMQGRGDHGMLITTGTFTAAAIKEAGRDGATTIDLIDGLDLCDLLRDHNLGVRTTERRVIDFDVDEAYFNRLEEQVP